jgi:hypothetical protein
MKPEKNTTGKPRSVPDDVREKQDPEYSEADFDEALEKATKRLGKLSERDPGSPRR